MRRWLLLTAMSRFPGRTFAQHSVSVGREIPRLREHGRLVEARISGEPAHRDSEGWGYSKLSRQAQGAGWRPHATQGWGGVLRIEGGAEHWNSGDEARDRGSVGVARSMRQAGLVRVGGDQRVDCGWAATGRVRLVVRWWGDLREHFAVRWLAGVELCSSLASVAGTRFY